MIVFADTETGGLDLADPIIQLAAIAVDLNWQEVASFNRKIRFDEAAANPEALAINHYDRATWEREAIPEAQVVREFGAFLNSYLTVQLTSKRTGKPYNVARMAAHNADFDKPRLNAMFDRHNKFRPWHPIWLCTVQRACFWGYETGRKLESLKLTSLCDAMGIPTAGAHDALADVRMSAAILKFMATQARTEVR